MLDKYLILRQLLQRLLELGPSWSLQCLCPIENCCRNFVDMTNREWIGVSVASLLLLFLTYVSNREIARLTVSLTLVEHFCWIRFEKQLLIFIKKKYHQYPNKVRKRMRVMLPLDRIVKNLFLISLDLALIVSVVSVLVLHRVFFIVWQKRTLLIASNDEASDGCQPFVCAQIFCNLCRYCSRYQTYEQANTTYTSASRYTIANYWK